MEEDFKFTQQSNNFPNDTAMEQDIKVKLETGEIVYVHTLKDNMASTIDMSEVKQEPPGLETLGPEIFHEPSDSLCIPKMHQDVKVKREESEVSYIHTHEDNLSAVLQGQSDSVKQESSHEPPDLVEVINDVMKLDGTIPFDVEKQTESDKTIPDPVKIQCYKCRADLVETALFCHMCGMHVKGQNDLQLTSPNPSVFQTTVANFPVPKTNSDIERLATNEIQTSCGMPPARPRLHLKGIVSSTDPLLKSCRFKIDFFCPQRFEVGS